MLEIVKNSVLRIIVVNVMTFCDKNKLCFFLCQPVLKIIIL